MSQLCKSVRILYGISVENCMLAYHVSLLNAGSCLMAHFYTGHHQKY